MRHSLQRLHTRFVAAGLGIGLAVVLSGVSITHAASWGGAGRISVGSGLVAIVTLCTAATIIVFSWHQIDAEMHPGLPTAKSGGTR